MSTNCENKLPIKKYGIEDVIKLLLNLLKPSVKLPAIPPALILVGAKLRPGLSPRKIAARIITRQAEAGAYSGALPDGSENVSEQMEIIRIEEIVKALQTEAKITTVVPPGQNVVTSGVGIGVVISNGVTTTTATATGILN